MKKNVLALLLMLSISISARETYNFNSDWHIDKQKKSVTLPHAWNEDDAYRLSTYEISSGTVWYRKKFKLPASAQGKRAFIEFEGARIAAEVFLNGKRIGMHENGVMAFGFELTHYLKKGVNTIEVKTNNDQDYKCKATDTKFQWNSPSFFANYGGLCKNVKLHVTDQIYQTLPLFSNLGTTGVYIYGKDYAISEHAATIHAESEVKNETDLPVTTSYRVVVEEMNGSPVATFSGATVTIPAHGTAVLSAEQRVRGLHFWSWGYGYLYRVRTYAGDDEVTTVTGFRKTEFKQGMIYLNDRVIQMHGYAQRSTNEWPGVGNCEPAWLNDYSNDLLVKSGGNVVRWMHVTPGKQDIESCDRVGLIEAMPAGDAEHDARGAQWVQRLNLMRDAIIYNRNNPSIIFYECGNQRISGQHMIEMKNMRNAYDPQGGRAIGCREMLDQPEAEYGGEMLYVNKSDTKPMWMMEYCRDEAHRFYWNSWSYPFHKEGDGPLYRGDSAKAYNHNNDEFAAELVRRWYDYWQERPGTGTMVNSGGAKIIFSDTQTHGRSADNYRVSGVTDAMRIPKDAFFASRVMWDGWVDDLKPRTYIVGHWNYDHGFVVPTVYVVSNADSVVLYQDNQMIAQTSREYHFLFTFKNVSCTADELVAVGYDKVGKEQSRYVLKKAGEPDHLRLTKIENPTGWKADGNDVTLVQVEVVDRDGLRCPLDNRLVRWQLDGKAEWRGGVAMNKPYGYCANGTALNSKSLDSQAKVAEGDVASQKHRNHVLCDTLPVECGINRVMLRSLPQAGRVVLTAKAEGLPDACLTLETKAVEVTDGLSLSMPDEHLTPVLDRGETPSSASFVQSMVNVYPVDVMAGSNQSEAYKSMDRYENTEWASIADSDSAWIDYTLAEVAVIDEICIKMSGFRNTSYPIAVFADGKEVWRGNTPKSLSFVRLKLHDAPAAQHYTIRLVGDTDVKDAFGAVREMDSRNNEKTTKGRSMLKIIEVEFLKRL